jgi:hypothetical protein
MSAVGAALGAYLPGALLASKLYSPGSLQTFAAVSSTWTYPDTTNLAVTASVPNSGNVIVRAHGGLIQANGNALVCAGVNTASSGTPLVSQAIGTATNNTGSAFGGALLNIPYHLEALLTGLGSGSTTFYLAFEVIGTNGDLYVDGADITAGGPLLITVTGA